MHVAETSRSPRTSCALTAEPGTTLAIADVEITPNRAVGVHLGGAAAATGGDHLETRSRHLLLPQADRFGIESRS